MSSEEGSNVSASISNSKYTIQTCEDLCAYCNELGLPLQTSKTMIRLINLTDDPMIVDFTLLIDEHFKVNAYKRSTIVNVRELIDLFQCKLTLYSQIDKIIAYLTNFPINMNNDLRHVGDIY